MTWHPKRWSIPWLLSVPGVGLVVLTVLWLAFEWSDGGWRNRQTRQA